MLAFSVALGSAGSSQTGIGLLGPVILLAVAVVVGMLSVVTLGRIVPPMRSALHKRRDARRRQGAATAEWRARALMSELCPNGWAAQIMVYGVDPGDMPRFTGHRSEHRVALDWAEFVDLSGRTAVTRRVWAPTIAEALEAMVADRRTDATLEQIERGAVSEGMLWPDG